MPDPTDSSPGAEPTPVPAPPTAGPSWSVEQPPGQAPPPGWGAPPTPPTPATGWPGWAAPPPAPRPGVIPLRPLSVSEVLEGAWGVFRRHWQLLCAVSAVVGLLIALASVPYALVAVDALTPLLALNPEQATTAEAEIAFDHFVASWEAMAAAVALTTLASLMGYGVLLGLVAVVTSQAALGRPAPWSAVRRRIAARLPALLGTVALVALTGVGFGLVAAGLVTVGWLVLGLGGALLGGLLALALVPVAVLVMVRWVVAAPVTVLEGASPTTALRRSWRLVQGQWWRTAGLLLLLGLIYGTVSAVISTPLSFVAQFGSTAYTTSTTVDPDVFLGVILVGLLANAVTVAVVYPFTLAAVAVKYLDLRMRREGLADQLAEAARDVRS